MPHSQQLHSVRIDRLSPANAGIVTGGGTSTLDLRAWRAGHLALQFSGATITLPDRGIWLYQWPIAAEPEPISIVKSSPAFVPANLLYDLTPVFQTKGTKGVVDILVPATHPLLPFVRLVFDFDVPCNTQSVGALYDPETTDQVDPLPDEQDGQPAHILTFD
jgi:hypothetical protein